MTAIWPYDGYRIAQKMRDTLLKRNVPIQDVFLFGSVALGKAKEDSDIDIAIVILSGSEESELQPSDVWEAAMEVDSRITPVLLTEQDFRNPLSTVAQEVKRYGIPVR